MSAIQDRATHLVEGAMETSPEGAGRARAARWLVRYLVRFGVVYAVLHALPYPLGFPGTERAAEIAAAIKEKPTAWLARALGLTLPTDVRNSGDSLASWLQVPTCAILALAIAGVVMATTRRRPADARWSAFHSTFLRYFLAAQMFAYGAVKVLKSQFPALEPSDLQTTYGESSPQGLLWRMMSLSTGYTVFTGLIEVLGAVLLFWRRTTVLGALLLSVALVQVVALNLAFDVPVKIGSIHLLVFTLVVLAPHARRLAMFLAGMCAPGRVDSPLLVASGLRARWALRGLKAAFVLGTVGVIGHEAWTAYRTWGDGKPPEPLVALYDVTKMEVADGPAEPWSRVTIDRNGFVVFGGRGALRGFEYAYDAGREALVIERGEDRLESAAGTTGAHPDVIQLAGRLGGRQATVELRRVPHDEIVLVSRGFRWVSNASFHR